MRILGIDPGLQTIGLGLIEAPSVHDIAVREWLVIRTERTAAIPERLEEIQRDLRQFLAETRPDLAVVERLFFAVNTRTAITVAQARGVILLTLALERIPVLEPTPLELKLCITGDGRADKRQVQAMVQRTLSLHELPKPDDAADALALALFGAFTARHAGREVSR